jgi:hypothetical protein
MASSKDDKGAPAGDIDPSLDDEDAAEGDEDEVRGDDEPVEGDDPEAPPLDPAAVPRFVSSKQARTVAEGVLRKIVPRVEVYDLATDALERALKARPPRVEAVLPAWLARIARRVGAKWLDKRKRRSKYEGDMPVRVAREDDYTGEARDDDGGRGEVLELQGDDPGKMLGPYLDKLIGSHEGDREVREILREHAERKKPYKAIAAERGLTETQLANRIHRFKAKYAPRVKRRRTQMFVLKAFLAFAAGVAAVILAWWLLSRRPDIRPDPSPPRLAPSASASAPPPEPFMPAKPPPTGSPDLDKKR